jgi:hypothetical protein
MNKTSKLLAAIVLAGVAAFSVSACKMPGAKPKETVAAPASSAVAETAPVTPDASASPPASAAVATDSAAPASSAKQH